MSEIIHIVTAPVDHEALPTEDDAPATGQWHWVHHAGSDGKPKRTLACVTAVGSNYAELHAPLGQFWRILLANFEDECTRELDPDGVIRGKVERYQTEVRSLMEEVGTITARLSVTTAPSLTSGDGGVAQALTLHRGEAVGEYKTALVHAKEETLPDLFKKIEEANKKLKVWLSASVIPLKAQADAMRGSIKAVERRIFAVELYAGLVEEVVQVSDGAPAAVGEKIRVHQRRCYMDEECLARYEVGGMEFADLDAFDQWLARPANRDRLLPHPRCVVAFRVRRHDKERGGAETLRQYIKMMELRDADKLTFLYLRNGEQVYRLSTAIEFGEQLFPDLSQRELGGRLYADVYWSGSMPSISRLVSEAQYLGMVEEESRRERDEAAKPEDERRNVYRESQRYERVDEACVYRDDVLRHVQEHAEQHNRLVLVLQGLLDRSPVFQPHPQWSLFTDGGFGQALELVYDDARALTPGEAPDFEAYRARLNASLRVGSVTIGQEIPWMEREADREAERAQRHGFTFSRQYYRPAGDPGPGKLARVVSVVRGRCGYEWAREKLRSTGEARGSIAVEVGRLFHVDAYRPGDFRQFFDDPRTRADYLEWAPLLLEAEEYHAGNRELRPAKTFPKRQKSPTGSYVYQSRKRRKALVGKAVRLISAVTTKGGKRHEKGSLWRVDSNRGRDFRIVGIDEQGRIVRGDDWRCVTRVPEQDFKVDDSIPPEPKEE